MRSLLAALPSGMVFGFGLTLSQMTDPQRILGFLNLHGDWDPTLVYVMAGALFVSLPGYALLRRRSKPLFGDRFASPPRWPVDLRLIVGACCFGIGWGLSGYCPGPAVVAAGLGRIDVILILLPSILAGGLLAGLPLRDQSRQRRAVQ